MATENLLEVARTLLRDLRHGTDSTETDCEKSEISEISAQIELEIDPQAYERPVAWLEQQRDEKAAWLKEIEQVLARLAPDDHRRGLGIAKWQEGLRAYERLCRAVPELQAGTCLDCDRLSPNGLTPCGACSEAGSLAMLATLETRPAPELADAEAGSREMKQEHKGRTWTR
jgi:hypothetical protein